MDYKRHEMQERTTNKTLRDNKRNQFFKIMIKYLCKV